jgi:hypothetical protein
LADYPDRTCAVSAVGIVFSKPKHAGCRIPAHDDDSFYAEVQRPLALQRTAAIFKQQLTSIIVLSLFSNIGKTGFAKAVPIDLFLLH